MKPESRSLWIPMCSLSHSSMDMKWVKRGQHTRAWTHTHIQGQCKTWTETDASKTRLKRTKRWAKESKTGKVKVKVRNACRNYCKTCQVRLWCLSFSVNSHFYGWKKIFNLFRHDLNVAISFKKLYGVLLYGGWHEKALIGKECVRFQLR